MLTGDPNKMPLAQSILDLGLGGQLEQQVDDMEAERKKKLLKIGQSQMSPAAISLLGNQNVK